MDWYILDENQNPIPATQDESHEFIKDINNRRIVLDEVGEYKVSTLFLGLDHGVGYVPHLFETMVFTKDFQVPEEGEGFYQERYATIQEAREGHRKAVEWVWITFYAKEWSWENFYASE